MKSPKILTPEEKATTTFTFLPQSHLCIHSKHHCILIFIKQSDLTHTRSTCPLKNNPSLQRTTTLWPMSRPTPSLLEAAGENGSFLGRPRPFPPPAPGPLILPALLALWPDCLLTLPCPCTIKTFLIRTKYILAWLTASWQTLLFFPPTLNYFPKKWKRTKGIGSRWHKEC